MEHAVENPMSTNTRRQIGTAAILVFAATLLLYSRVTTHEFIVFDDPGYVYENRHVMGGLTVENVVWAFTTGERSNWHPLTWLSHMLDVELYGGRAGGHHFTNALIHAINAALVLVWLRMTSSALYPALFVALAFGLHPLHVESVAWVSERKDVLCAFFFLLSLIAYTRYCARPGAGRYVATTACFILALLSKPMAVTWPCVALLTDLWPHRRLWARDERRRPLRRCVVEKVPWFALSAAHSVVTLYVQRAGEAVRTFESVPLPIRLENAVVSAATYLVKTFVPVRLAVFYPYPSAGLEWWRVAVSLAVLVGISILVLAMLRSRPYLAVGWFWFLGMLTPVIGIVQVGDQALADRYMYLPQIGVLITIAWLAREVVSGRPAAQWSLRIVTTALCAAMAGLSWAQLGRWRDSESLMTHTLEVTRDNAAAHALLGYAYQQRRATDLAAEQYRRALAIDRQQVNALNNLSVLYLDEGRWVEAEQKALEAIAVQPTHAAAYYNLGVALEEQGRYDPALDHYAKALQLQPDFPKAYSRLGGVLMKLGKGAEAAEAYRAYTRLLPDNPSGWINLGVALSSGGRFDEAIPQFHRALSLDEANPDARYYLALALHSIGRSADAKVELKKLLATRPDYGDAHALAREIDATNLHADPESMPIEPP
ncbi:MAG: hypothetical protein AMXMBFR4_11360 [Candidatus Hydrogenedentota bacterium]